MVEQFLNNTFFAISRNNTQFQKKIRSNTLSGLRNLNIQNWGQETEKQGICACCQSSAPRVHAFGLWNPEKALGACQPG
jgi:hypothetical protein